MIDLKFLSVEGEILYYGVYKRYWSDRENRVVNPELDDFTRAIMDVKANGMPEKKRKALQRFSKLLNRDVALGTTICYVPSSDPEKTSTGIRSIAEVLCEYGRIDATSCLERHVKIQSAKEGGPRNRQVHYNSIRVVNKHLVQDKDILLLDDVTTTSSSLLACKELLIKYGGARSVLCVALGQTEGY